MVKVRESQIPEESGKPQFSKSKNIKTTRYYSKDSSEDENDVLSESEDDDSKLLKRTMIHFRNEGVSISAYDFHTIEKDLRFVEKPHAHWEFGIVINKGLEQRTEKNDLSMWYMKEETRDDKMEHIMEILKIYGLKVIEIS